MFDESCPVCERVTSEEAERAHLQMVALWGMSIEGCIDSGKCPRCGTQGNDPAKLRKNFDQWPKDE